jgi:bacterioferritin
LKPCGANGAEADLVIHASGTPEGLATALAIALLTAVEGRSVMLEEYARQMIFAEEQHAGEVDKMLRKPGDVEASGLGPSSLK